MANATVSKLTGTLNRPMWQGGRTLYLGELIVFALAIAVYYFKLLGATWSLWVAFIMMLLAMIIW